MAKKRATNRFVISGEMLAAMLYDNARGHPVHMPRVEYARLRTRYRYVGGIPIRQDLHISGRCLTNKELQRILDLFEPTSDPMDRTRTLRLVIKPCLATSYSAEIRSLVRSGPIVSCSVETRCVALEVLDDNPANWVYELVLRCESQPVWTTKHYNEVLP